MGLRFFLLCCTIFLFPSLGGCKETQPAATDSIVNGKRIIYFSGHYWEVGTSAGIPRGPGPNYFSDHRENVWLDENNRLHLRITHRAGKWYCANVTLLETIGLGRYVFFVDSRIDLLDKNVVCGLFTYQSDTEEVDIEFSRRGVDGAKNGHFSVQPSTISGNTKGFDIKRSNSQTTHWFNWQSGRIDFASFTGHSTLLPANRKMLKRWSYRGANIPLDSNESLKINLWLFMGRPPSDLQEVEMIISGIRIL
jgi:hypothetical protein